MSYLAEVMSPNERVIQQARFAWVTYAAAWLSLIFLGIVVIGIVIFFRIMLQVWTTELAVTNHRLVYKRGWLSRHVDEIELQAIEQVDVEQGFWGRLFNFGVVVISGTGVDEIRTPVIAEPVQFSKAIDQAVHG